MGKILLVIVQFMSVLVLAFLWVGTALADKRVALIVGNSQYARISPKPINPANDANDLAQALAGIGFDVILRTDVRKGEFDQALVEFARKARNADTALFYYAGYGLQHHGENFFLPIDVEVQDVADLEFQTVGFDSVQQAIDRSAGVKIVILDASRDNSLARQLIASRSWGGDTHGLARINSAEETIIASATAPDQVAQDGAGRNSPFTEALVRRIKEPGLEIGTMFRRVTSDVYEMTNGRQRPEVSISLLTDYFLIPVESPADEAGASHIGHIGGVGFGDDAPPAPKPRSPQILETGYSLLKDIGGEKSGYGLYSYALMVNYNSRSAKFLSEVFSAIPPVEELPTPRSQINILSVPLKKNKAKALSAVLKLNDSYLVASTAAFAKEFYDYKVGRSLLNHLCNPPAEEIRTVCEGDLSRGPYVFTYAKPASKVTPVPPPFLFIDLSDVHERAFPEIIAAFKAQVKREDISDRAKIDTLRLKVLNTVLNAADWLVPVRKAVTDIVYSASGHTEKDKQ